MPRLYGIFIIGIFVIGLSGCNLAPDEDGETVTSETTVPEATAEPPWSDENAVMSGICFESAWDAAGQVFVLRNEEELSRLFDLSDNSHLCRRPVQRYPFDFGNGRVLAGLWSAGRGCTADHELIGLNRDDEGEKLEIRLRLVIEGDCAYELVRPFWIGLEGARDYEITIVVE